VTALRNWQQWALGAILLVGSTRHQEGRLMAERGGRKIGGLTTGGIVVIVGILLLIFWSIWIGLIVILIGLIAFGGFARGKWY
jgi:uncharacterized membrane protein YecN with MAPEG domain